MGNGDKVYFLRENKWKGPGWVIGQDNVVVFIRYGGTLVRVHESRIKRDLENSVEIGKKVVNDSQPQCQVKSPTDKIYDNVCHDDENDDEDSPDKVQTSEDPDIQENVLEHESDSDYDPTEDIQEPVENT